MTTEQNKSPPRHTPGPWWVREGVFIDAPKFRQVAYLRGVENDPTTKATAHLIAAAPDLLFALELCCVRDPSLNMNAAVTEAISKARGQQ